MRLIDADELITAFPCGETVRTECVRATIKHMAIIDAIVKRTTGDVKPCPFCGTMPVIHCVDATYDTWYVECVYGGCSCKPETWYYDTKEEAIEAWNRRAN